MQLDNRENAPVLLDNIPVSTVDVGIKYVACSRKAMGYDVIIRWQFSTEAVKQKSVIRIVVLQ
jgi:hypothetical protein